jgi:hypothetical protein
LQELEPETTVQPWMQEPVPIVTHALCARALATSGTERQKPLDMVKHLFKVQANLISVASSAGSGIE